jgi:guanosine-3',5'-bis(diphosphate) 3'-pyrophosphohydrolase
MRQYELVERVMQYDKTADEEMLNRAYVYAMQAHGSQRRASGEPYFSHPLQVAAILANMKLDDATIAAALLHDTIEDTHATRQEIDTLFGAEIGSLVDGLTKIRRLDLASKRVEQAENFRKLLVAISSDIRVLLVKLADRLHNMRTLEHVKPAKRRAIATETMEIYAPLAGRMGMQEMKDELSDLAFRWLDPEAHETVASRMALLRQRNAGLVEEILGEMKNRLASYGVDAEITGREKKLYSIWRKMENKQISLEQLSDIYGFRAIVEDTAGCYNALGAIHTRWPVVPGRFKDYISTPKQNDYQSIHTTVVGPRHQRVEVQIRTRWMHYVAEYGVAAHALYKDALGQLNGASRRAPDEDSAPYQWLRKLVANLLEGDNPEEFLEHTKLELFQDQVYCFTPKGRLIALPRNANAIDFAYAVHTDIGNRCVGAKINGRHMPLVTALKNGDEVEIICSEAQTPPAAWERLALTGKARSAIRRATREAVRNQYRSVGREILRNAFEIAGKPYDDGEVKRGLHRLAQPSVDDVLACVGRGELKSTDVLRAVHPGIEWQEPPKRKAMRREDEGWFNLGWMRHVKFRLTGSSAATQRDIANGIPIRGAHGGEPIRFAEGGAVPGDRIVGIMEDGNGITIYPIHSSKLSEYEDQLDRWIDVTWDIEEGSVERFPVQISVNAINAPGSLAKIAALIGESGGNIDRIEMRNRDVDFTDMLITVEVYDLKHLNDILAGVRGLKVVGSADRTAV